jgi:tetratricopeptide (TPR) repeat protein
MVGVDPGDRSLAKHGDVYDAAMSRFRRAALTVSRSSAVLLAAGVLTLQGACRAGPAAESRDAAAGSAAARPVVILGLDGADWLAIGPLVRDGKLPGFARLMAVGRTGVMASTPPLISPIIWTTIATGQHPENHGILDFMVDLPGGRQSPVTSTHRLSPALWNLASEAGRRVAFVGWWATWPAEPVRGVMVSDALAPQLARADARLDAGLVSPETATSRVMARVVRPIDLRLEDLSAYVALSRAEFDAARSAGRAPAGRLYENRLAHLATVVASTRSYSAIALDLLRTEHPDVLGVYLEAIDTVSHLFVRDPARGPQAIAQAYRDADALLRQLAEASSPEALVVVCSDHGFYPPGAAIAEDPSDLTGPATAWHRPSGIVAAATAGALSGRASRSHDEGPREIGRIAPVDVVPTVLHAAGLAVPSDMPGRVVTDLLPRDEASRDVRRAPPSPVVPASPATPGTRQTAEALARLQALGYVGAVTTSLARQNLGEILYRRGRLEAAERELRAVLEAQPDNLTAMLWLAKALVGQRRAGEALRVYERAVTLPRGARAAVVEAVDLAIASHRSERARAIVAAARVPHDAVAALAVARGALAEAAGGTVEAERHYRRALDSDPLSLDAAARLLELLVRAGRARDAVPALSAAARTAPDSPQHLALLGEALLASRDGAGAEAVLARALVLAPEGDLVRLALARSQIVQQKAAAAVATLSPSAPSGERDALLGAAHSALGQWGEAARSFQAALDGGPASADVLNGLGWAQMKMGERGRARGTFGRSLALKADQPHIRRLLADLQGAGAPAASSR